MAANGTAISSASFPSGGHRFAFGWAVLSFYINSWLEELSLDITRMQEETLSCESCDAQVTADKMSLCCTCHSILCESCFDEHKECSNVPGIDEG